MTRRVLIVVTVCLLSAVPSGMPFSAHAEEEPPLPPVEPRTSGETSATTEELEAPSIGTPGDDSMVATSESNRFRRGALALGIGGAYWSNLGKVQPNPAIFDPTAFGSPNTWGISVEVSGHVRIARRDRLDLFVGMDLGFLSFENKKTFDTPGTAPGTESSRLLTQAIYATPSIKLYYHTAHVRPFIGGGAGFYGVELSAKTEFGELIEEFVKKNTFGGYVSAGIDIPIGSGSSLGFLLRIEDKLHFVDFGNLGTFSPSSGTLSGPINMVQVAIGVVF